MSIELPLYAQEKRNTCALACLRMVLAAYGTHLDESAIEAEATMEDEGAPIEEIARLARRYGLIAEIQETTVADLRRILRQGGLPIAFIDRAVFDMAPRERLKHSIHDAKIHTVIPNRLSSASVTFHDPLPPRVTRRSISVFDLAHRLLGRYCVICSQRQSL
jgi:ABC-type bacteriocin/lantibiotic exporter with double-glycine peptidase domain